MWVERRFANRDIAQLHQACGYGSLRPKWTKLVANFEQVHTINKLCPQNHKHEAWGVVSKNNKRRFATALEVHYPVALCEAIVQAFALYFVQQGQPLPQTVESNASAQAYSGVIPATSSIQLFLPEYKNLITVLYDSAQMQVWPQNFCPPIKLGDWEVWMARSVRRNCKRFAMLQEYLWCLTI